MTAALIVAFRRPSNLSQLIQSCLENGIERIYVHLDAPTSLLSQVETRACFRVAQSFQDRSPETIKIRRSDQNLGTAAAVINACNWVFENEEYSIILEDDCLPSDQFFDFVRDTRQFVTTSPRIFAASGTQLAPSSLTQENLSLSAYLMIWGWATSRDKWQRMFSELMNMNLETLERGSLDIAEFAYWRSGARRALQGIVDAWDIPLMLNFRINNRLVVLPNCNLITNIGSDHVAINTDSRSKFTQMPLGTYKGFTSVPSSNDALDEWIKRAVFGISWRHLLSTKLTHLYDCLVGFRSKRGPLLARLHTVHQ